MACQVLPKILSLARLSVRLTQDVRRILVRSCVHCANRTASKRHRTLGLWPQFSPKDIWLREREKKEGGGHFFCWKQQWCWADLHNVPIFHATFWTRFTLPALEPFLTLVLLWTRNKWIKQFSAYLTSDCPFSDAPKFQKSNCRDHSQSYSNFQKPENWQKWRNCLFGFLLLDVTMEGRATLHMKNCVF